MTRNIVSILVGLSALSCAACANHNAVNPSFAVTSSQAKDAWKTMESSPARLERPLIVLGGIYDPGAMANHIADQIKDVAANDELIRHCSFFFDGSFDRCARKLIETVDDAFPTADPTQTVEVDAVAFSMGGLVARHAASDGFATTNGRRLRIARLFTIGSPHRGAKLACVPTFDRRIVDMRTESEFLETLNAEDPDYEIVPICATGR